MQVSGNLLAVEDRNVAMGVIKISLPTPFGLRLTKICGILTISLMLYRDFD